MAVTVKPYATITISHPEPESPSRARHYTAPVTADRWSTQRSEEDLTYVVWYHEQLGGGGARWSTTPAAAAWRRAPRCRRPPRRRPPPPRPSRRRSPPSPY